MNLPAEVLADPDFVRYSPLIGVSRYLLVDSDGNPIESGDDNYKQRTMTISAYHGSEQPVVYWMYVVPSYIDEKYGYSTSCGVRGILHKTPGTDVYHFSTTGRFKVFENRFFYGEYNCAPDDTSILPALDEEFTIEVNDKDSMVLTGEDGTPARFKSIPVE